MFGPRPFKFKMMWLDVPMLKEKIKTWWEEEVMEGTTSYVFWQKLKSLKHKLFQWNKVFVKVEERKRRCLDKMMDLELKNQSVVLSDGESQAWEESKLEYKRLFNMEKIS